MFCNGEIRKLYLFLSSLKLVLEEKCYGQMTEIELFFRSDEFVDDE